MQVLPSFPLAWDRLRTLRPKFTAVLHTSWTPRAALPPISCVPPTCESFCRREFSFTGCGVLAVILVAALLDQIDLTEEENNEADVKTSIWKLLLDTFRQLRDKRQCLLIPLTIFSGFQQGFLSSDYTRAYVTCTLGIHFVGYVMICFGATNSICSMLFGKLVEYTGRIPLFMLAAVTSASCIIALLLWSPHPNQCAVFFIFPALWSMSDAICQTLLSAFYGVLFDDHKEAAFANYRIWESLGFVISFAYSNFLCVYVKLYIVLSIMLLGMTLYLVVEYLEYRKKNGGAMWCPIKGK
ncbi:protein unc-93 homolog A-like [Pelodytes ibericus]